MPAWRPRSEAAQATHLGLLSNVPAAFAPTFPPLLRTHAVGYVSQTTPHARPARARSSCERTSGRARQRVLCVQRDHVARPPRAAQLRDHVRIGRSISSSEQRGTGLTFAPIPVRRAPAPLPFAQVASGFMAPAPVALRANAARSSRSFACLFSLLISRDVFVAPMEPCYGLAGHTEKKQRALRIFELSADSPPFFPGLCSFAVPRPA